MNFNYPDFLQERRDQGLNSHVQASGSQGHRASEVGNKDAEGEGDGGSGNTQFNDILFSKLTHLEETQSRSPTSGMMDGNMGMGQFGTGVPGMGMGVFGHQRQTKQDSFNLPVELQGGVGTISSRRPSYAAESFTRSNLPASYGNFMNLNMNPGSADHRGDSQDRGSFSNSSNSDKNSLATYAAAKNYTNNHNISMNQFNDSFNSINLNSNFNDFQSRRPSQLVDIQGQQLNQFPTPLNYMPQPNQNANSMIKLENGLILRDQYIVASPNLKSLYMKTAKYFQNVETSESIIRQLNSLIGDPVILKLITFIKNLNNLTFNHKILCLVINKNGKFDLLSYPNNSNIFLQKHDLVIVDGDRGKDLVMILEPLVNLNFAILFNFLKKLEHLKSLTILDNHFSATQNQHHLKSPKKPSGGTHSTSLNASAIVNSHSNEDNEFIVTLPTKQVLRFATPKEIHKISGKFLEEKKAFITCFNKIKELNLHNDLQLINVEYQSDFKKLIFYYFAGFKRIDFRGLIKELFKIYKTRIWLCAVLPFDKPELYITMNEDEEVTDTNGEIKNYIPNEYELSNEQILNFSINEFQNLAEPNYFHLVNLNNLVKHLSNEIKGNFYGFNNKDAHQHIPPPSSGSNATAHQNSISSSSSNTTAMGGIFDKYDSNFNFSNTSNILPNFNPFGDDKNNFPLSQ